MDKETLKAALESLDVLNDSHWTSEGAPAIQAVNENLPEGVHAKRSDVTGMFPLFNRENTNLDESEGGDDPDQPEKDLKQPEETKDAEEEKAEESEEVDPTKQALFQAEDDLEAARVDLDDAQKRLADAQARYASAKADYDKAHPPMTQAQIIKEHLLAQQRSRAERMGSVRAVIEAARQQAVSPLDRAMAAKRGLGRERPQYPRRGG